MSWQFWKKKATQKQETTLEDIVKTEVVRLQESLDSLHEQMNKTIRLQFKTSKNTEDKLKEISSLMSQNQKETRLVEQYQQKEKRVATQLIQLLDELDHIVSELDNKEQKWHHVFSQWSNSLVDSLAVIGIYPMDILHKPFDPTVAESIQTVTKQEVVTLPIVPYQMVKVIQRGYLSENGKIIRKAKVVTVEEDA